MRLGLCCKFLDEAIHFRATTARFVGGKTADQGREFLGEIAVDNVAALRAAIAWCGGQGVGAFRITSGLFPLATHPTLGYRLDELPTWTAVERGLRGARDLARRAGVRLSFHPDQFVVPGSLSPSVSAVSLAELEHLGQVAQRLGAAQLTLHGGGAASGKEVALTRLARALDRLTPGTRALIALENDDRVYTVRDLLPLGLPLVYDVHHHRCNPDGLDEEEATDRCAATWGEREPWAHVSSPREGWRGPQPRPHADYIDPGDLPRIWLDRRLTVDVEAKAKERAVLQLARWVARCREERPVGR